MSLIPSAQRPPKSNPPVGALILTPSFREVGRKTRHSKVRSGCSTCKQRKVKCDETKPECLRCTKAGKLCGGYEELKPWLFEPQVDLDHETSSDASTKRHRLQATRSTNRLRVIETHCETESDARSDNASSYHSSIPTWSTCVDSYMPYLKECYSAPNRTNMISNLLEFGMCTMSNFILFSIES
jgi:hypothetical protein